MTQYDSFMGLILVVMSGVTVAIASWWVRKRLGETQADLDSLAAHTKGKSLTGKAKATYLYFRFGGQAPGN